VTLREIINQLETLPDAVSIYATKSKDWDVDAPAALVLEADASEIGIELEELRYFLEVYIAKEALEVWNEWRNGALPTTEERIAAVLYYASHDAYIN
jgi:hypothetical protein